MIRFKRSMLLHYSLLILVLLASISQAQEILKVYTTNSLAKMLELELKHFEDSNNCKIIFIQKNFKQLLSEVKILKLAKDGVFLGSYDAMRDEAYQSDLSPVSGQTVFKLPINWENSYLVPISFAFVSFIYDQDIVKTPLNSFSDLVNCPYKIIICDPRTSMPGESLIYWVHQVYGEDTLSYWEKLKTKILSVSKNWSQAYLLFLRKEAPIMLSYTGTQLAHRAKGEHSIVSANFAEGQYLEIFSAAILNQTQNKALAQKFINFLLSPALQKQLAIKYYSYPVINIPELAAEFYQYPKIIAPLIKSWPEVKQLALRKFLEALS